MRKLAVVLGAAMGGYFGWVLGDSIDGLMSSFDATQPVGHGRAIMFGFAVALFWSYSFYRLAVGFSSRRARNAKIESRADVQPTVLVMRPKSVSHRTPPAPTPAFQA